MENHLTAHPRVEVLPDGVWDLCPETDGFHEFKVGAGFFKHLDGPVHLLICRYCGLHIELSFDIVDERHVVDDDYTRWDKAVEGEGYRADEESLRF